MSKATNIKATLIDETGGGLFRRLKETPGAFAYTNTKLQSGEIIGDVGILSSCPCGCGHIGGMNLKNVPGEKRDRPMWTITGPREAPTLSPSVGIRTGNEQNDTESGGYHWHGYLRKGIWESA
jgi:hypothetical protein